MKYKMIKRVLLMLSLFLFTSSISFAQQHPGFKAGVNFASLKSDQIEFENTVGFGGGFATMWVVNNRLDFFIDFTFENFGMKVMGREAYDYNSPLGSTYNEYSLSSNGVYGSILPNYAIIPERLSVNAGFIYGFTWANEGTNDQLIYVGNGDYLEDNVSLSELSSMMSGGDFYLAFGISGGTEALKLNLRYNLGLRNYAKNSNYDYSDLSIKRNFLQISISYFFLNAEII
jgi:hypothetical protein